MWPVLLCLSPGGTDMFCACLRFIAHDYRGCYIFPYNSTIRSPAYFFSFSGRVETLGWITLSTPNCITGHKPNLKCLIHSHSSVPSRLLWLNVLSISYVLSRGETKTKPCNLEKTNSKDFYPLRPESCPKSPQGIRGVKEGIHSLG